MKRSTLLTAALTALLAATSAQADDTGEGRQVFTRCKICHTVEKGGQNLLGPNLHGLFGRKAGSLPNFSYSAAMRRSGIVWSEKTLAGFLHDPAHFVPGNRMGFPGVKNADELEHLLHYLKQATR